MSVGWEVKGVRSLWKPIMYWSVYVCPHVHIQTRFRRTPECKCFHVFRRNVNVKMWFLLCSKEAGRRRWRCLTQYWRKCNSSPEGNQCLGTWFVIWVQSKKQSVHPELTVSLNYSSYITISAYIRTWYWKVTLLYCQFTSSESHMCIIHTAGLYESHPVLEMIDYSVLFSRLCCRCGCHPSLS